MNLVLLNMLAQPENSAIYRLGICFLLSLSLLLTAMTYASSPALDSLLLEIEARPDDTSKVDELTELAWNIKHNQPQKGLFAARRALKIANQINYEKGLSDASHTLGMIYWNQGEYSQASEFYFAAMRIRERLGDSLNLARSYNNVGNIYFRQKKLQDALHYYQLSQALRLALQDSVGMIYSLNNLGDVYGAEGNLGKALQHYEEAYQMAKKIADEKGQAFIALHLADFHLQQQAYLPAQDYFKTSLFFYKKLNHHLGMVKSYNGLAKTLVLQKRDPEQSLAYARKAIEIAKSVGAKRLQSEAQIMMAAAYALRGDYRQAYNLERKSRFLETEIVNESRERAIIETQIQYDVDNQRSALLLQENELLLHKQQLSQMQMFIVFCFLIGAIVISAMIFFRWREQASMNEVLADKNKELQHSNQALERFAYVASHDLKEPLRTIGSFTTLLNRRYRNQLDDAGKEYMNYIVSGVDRMYSLLEDLLKYSRLIHQNEENKEAVDFNEIIHSVTESLNHRIKEREVDIEVPSMPSVVSNAAQIQQLFQNLINNAIKFNDKEQPRVAIECEERPGEYLFAVKDNGLGIEEQYQNQIFEVFKRLSRDGYEGTGVGLAICKKIVEQHEGQIWVESEEGEGSTFYFTLPNLQN